MAGLGFDSGPAVAHAAGLKIRRGREVTTICPFCAVGCGQIVSVSGGKIINVEGDPDHPINQGSLCGKGGAMYQVGNNDQRITKVKYRAPGSDKWQEKSWDWALSRIAEKICETRDSTFKQKAGDHVVNRTEGLAWLGSAALNNEECYLTVKFARSLGIVYLEHQARICHSSTVAALGETFGRGAMTNHWIDIRNSDCIMIIGSNAAENHPVSFKWVTAAIENNGATLISVDPRFTRTSSKAHIYAPIRSGTDIAFIGGLINYCLENQLYNKEYVTAYTNAAFVIDPKYSFHDGLFCDYDSKSRRYDRSAWRYQVDETGATRKDKDLKDPNCAFQLLKKHYARYDINTVCQTTGTPPDVFLKVAKAFCATGAKGKAATIMYAMGTTQHTNASQMIRSYAILQLLLGNIGVAGGGINALRGWSNVQGATDHCLLFHILPGYLKTPRAEDKDLGTYLQHWTPQSSDPKSINYWKNTPRFIVSLLKAFWGDAAKKENDFCYDYLPKISGDCSHISLFERMYDGGIKGMICLGENPAVSGPNVRMERKALEKLDWLVVADLWETETAAFWKGPEAKASEIKTEVFLLPAAASFEKKGSITNSGRWAQWRYEAINPPGDARSDLWIIDALYKRVRKIYEEKGGVCSDPVNKLTWDYGRIPDANRVAAEINGYDLATGKLLPSFGKLQDDGSTSAGNWLYCGSYTEDGNMMARRETADPTGIGLYSGWAWCWPMNRRILYNRASCDTKGQPWNNEKAVLRWTGKEWCGDVPDYGKTTPPEQEAGAFIMKPEGHARIFGMGLVDGPFPEHYEPRESPVSNILSRVQNNPTIKIWESNMDQVGSPDDFPIVATTYRMSEHFLGGQMTRNLPWLVELVPDMFVEIGKELAQRKSIQSGDRVRVSSARGQVTGYALVTDRFKPFKLKERTCDEIGLVWHFGFIGLAKGDSANCLTPHVGDANTMIPEYKAFLCNICKEG